MMSATQSAIPSEIQRDLEFMTRRWHELDQPVKFEIRALAEGKTPQWFRFNPDAEGIADAVKLITEMNGTRNFYVVRNPIRADVPASRAATDDDIVAAFLFWADCDNKPSAENVKRFDGPKFTAHIVTGRIPETRVHPYWDLDKPLYDMAIFRDMQQRIAQHFGSDSAVINPSRIMRVAGSVTHPDSKKRDRGYVSEITTLRTEYPDTRPPVTLDQMQRVFGEVVVGGRAAPRDPATANNLQIDTGPQPLDRELMAIKALSGKEWHDAIVRLTGSYVSKGLSDPEIHALTDGLTLAGYTVEQTRREVQTAINGARRKGWTPETNEFVELSPAEIEAIPAVLFKPWVAIDPTTIPVPDFIYSDFYARGYTSLTVAPPKVGKSLLALAEAIDMATGIGFLHDCPSEPRKVVYYNAEDDQDVMNNRVMSILTHYGINQSQIEGRLFATSGVGNDDFFMVSGQQEGVINEALFVGIEKFCEEQQADCLIFDPLQDLSQAAETNEVFRMLGQRLRKMANKTHVALGLVHHTRKLQAGVAASMDDARGGSALRGSARFNRLLVPMSEGEGVSAGVENHRHFMRVGEMESNLAPPSADVNRWFEKVSVLTPNNSHVGAVVPWEWPDPFEGISPKLAAQVRSAVDGKSEPPRYDTRAKYWIGKIVSEICGIEIEDGKGKAVKSGKARCQGLVDGWIKTDVLRIDEVHDKRSGRAITIVFGGANNPLVTEGDIK
jgi:hypothetical protein